ncbi:MAG: hypothetical protein OXH47_08325, partial [Paracoccaceae bacterium]|nr:hypothetical protein [Paracoccaceae bacterium]
MSLFQKAINLATSLHSRAEGQPFLQKIVPGLEGGSLPLPDNSIPIDKIAPWLALEVEALLDWINPLDVGVIPKFCHHVSGYNFECVRSDQQAVQKILLPFHEKLYGDPDKTRYLCCRW